MNIRSTNRTYLLLALAAAPMLAQGVSVQLGGTVTSEGRPVAGATVTLRNLETGYSRVLQTDAQGRYLAATLPVGPYAVTVTKAGFQSGTAPKVTLNLGDAAPLNFKLVPEAAQTVVVTASLAPVDSDRASAAAFVSPDNLASLPVFNRSFTSLATLTPQVQVDNQRGNLAIAGQRGVNTSINIDGGDVNEPFFGGATGAAEGKTPFTVSIEAIREYQVITDGASAEFGRMGGGYVNAITKSGGNDLSGSLFYYTRPKGMKEVAPPPYASTAANNFKLEQFGFSIGGPILKDRLFYFVAYDGQRRTSPVNFYWGTSSTPAVLNPGNVNDAALISRNGAYDSKADSDVFFARFDYFVNADQTLQLRINHSDFKGDTSTGQANSYSNTSTDNVKTDNAVLQWNWTISPTLLNEARLNYVKDDLPRQARSTTPQVSITNVGFYGAYPFERSFNTKRVQLSESLSFITTTFQLKGGVDYNKLDVSEVFASFYRGGYTFTNLANFEAGNWGTYQQLFGLNGLTAQQAGNFSASEKQMAAYIQADWRPIESLKLGLGLRWDKQEHPQFPILNYAELTATPVTATNPNGATAALDQHIPNDAQFSPRFSLTWTPEFDHGKTVLRFNVGRYVSTTPSVFLYQAFTANAIRSASVTFVPGQAAAFGIPIGAAFNANQPFSLPSSIPAGATIPPANVFTFAPNFKNPYTDRANLGAERAFGDLVLGASGTYARGKQLERVLDTNLGTPTANAQGRLIFPAPVAGGTNNRPNTYYRQMAEYVSDADSIYHAYTLSLKYHKDGSALDAQVYYTLAWNKDNDSNERNFSSYSQANTQRLGDDWSWADTDRRQTLTGYLSYTEPQTSLLTSLTMRYVTGFAYSLTVAGDRNNDGVTGNDRVYSGGRDTGRNDNRASSTMLFDLGLRREFKLTKAQRLTISVDVFNLFNRFDTYYRPVVSGATDAATVLTPGQALATGVDSGRQVQLGARYSF